MSDNLISRCQGRWRTILPELGIPVSALTGKHGPCPICGGKDRFRFDDRKPAGSGSWLCNHCGSGYGIHLVMKVNGWSFKEAADRIDEALGTVPAELIPSEDYPGRSLDNARSLWRGASPIRASDAAGRYLTSRHIAPDVYPKWLRYSDRVLYLEDGEFCGRFPAMLAVVITADYQIAGVHRTYLSPDGLKADVPSPRKLMGTLPDGAAVRLADHTDVLGVAEGIETALSATALFGIPSWAAINSHCLTTWSPPLGVREVVVFGDNDLKFGGQAAAWSLAHRLACRGFAVRVEIPSTPGDDWNDVLMKGGAGPLSRPARHNGCFTAADALCVPLRARRPARSGGTGHQQPSALSEPCRSTAAWC